MMLIIAKKFPFLLKILLKIQTKRLGENPKKTIRNFIKIMSQPDQEILKNAAVMEVIENTFKEAFRNGSKGVAYEVSNLLVRNWDFELNKIQVPVTFWQGKKDNNIPFQWAQYMSNRIKGSHLKQYPEKGHLMIFEYAKEIFTDLKKKIP